MFVHAISILTSLAVFLHSLGGCCWHHDHRDCKRMTIDGDVTSFAYHNVEGADRNGHQLHSIREDHYPSSPCHHSQDCNEGNCVALEIESPDLSMLDPSLLIFSQVIEVVLEARIAVSYQNSLQLVFDLGKLATAQQYCALSQSWLF